MNLCHVLQTHAVTFLCSLFCRFIFRFKLTCAMRWTSGESWFDSLHERKFCLLRSVQMNCGAHPEPHSVGTAVRWLKCEVDHSHSPTAEIDSKWSYIFTPQYTSMAWCFSSTGTTYLYRSDIPCCFICVWNLVAHSKGGFSRIGCWGGYMGL